MKFSFNGKSFDFDFTKKEAVVVIPLILTFLFYFKFPEYAAILCLGYYTSLLIYYGLCKTISVIYKRIRTLKCSHCKSKDVVKNVFGITIDTIDGYSYDGYLRLQCGKKSFHNTITDKLYKLNKLD